MFQRDYSLQTYNTLGFEAKAEYFISVQSLEGLRLALSVWARRGPLHILGGGSNILLQGAKLPGLCLHNRLRGLRVYAQNQDYIGLEVAAGEVWDELVAYTVAQGWGGLENLSLIPGYVGAAPVQNIGAYGVELAQVLEAVQVLDTQRGRLFWLAAQACELGYRDSIFKRQEPGAWVITAIRLKLSPLAAYRCRTHYGDIEAELQAKGLSPSPAAVREVVMAIRRSKLPDPKDLGNAGSFFKNPVLPQAQALALKAQYPLLPLFPTAESTQIKLPAAWLIEQAGWKGRRLGQVGVHSRQALVLVHHGGGQGQALAQLAAQIQADVAQKFGVKLQTEVNFW